MGLFKNLILLLGSLVILLIACQTETSGNLFAGFEKLKSLETAYKENPNPKSANELIKVLLEKLKEPSLDKSKRSSFLNYGFKISKEQNITSRAASFLFPIIKETKADPNPTQVFELAGMMKSLKKTAAANTLYQSIIDKHPTSADVNAAKAAISDTFTSIDNYIYNLGEQLFVDPDNTGINRNAAMKYVDACEAYALGYPGTTKTPEYLFKSAEVAKSLRTFSKSLSLYDWILERYPEYEKAPTALFLKGFIIENNIGDDKRAGEIYDSFLSTYPNHDLADDVQFLIENLGKTDEEILEMIESKRKDK